MTPNGPFEVAEINKVGCVFVWVVVSILSHAAWAMWNSDQMAIEMTHATVFSSVLKTNRKRSLKDQRQDLRNKFNDNELVISTLMITVLNVLSIIPLMSGLFRICLENDFFPFLFVFGVVLEFVR